MRNVRVIVEGLARHMYNLSALVSVHVNVRLAASLSCSSSATQPLITYDSKPWVRPRFAKVERISFV